MSETFEKQISAEDESVKEVSEKANADKKSGKADPFVVLNDRIKVFYEDNQRKYDRAPASAYRASDTRDAEASYLAYVCEPSFVPRLHAAGAYKSLKSNPVCVLPFVDEGVLSWPHDAKRERYVFVYEDILGENVIPESGSLALGWSIDKVLTKVLHPFSDLLHDFSRKNFAHGGIRLDNFYEHIEADDKSPLVLGDCLSVPASYSQPTLYETLYRSMADPLARGQGTIEDDLYALGMCIALMLRTVDTTEGLADKEIIRKKIEMGSYMAVLEKDRLPSDAIELLRGLLHDDPTERWGINNFLLWVDGKRLSPKQTTRHTKAPRPMSLGEDKFFYLSTLAMNIDRHKGEFVKSISNGSLHQWLSRSVENEELSEQVDLAISKASEKKSKQQIYEDVLVSHVSMALDSMAPLRYKGRNIMINGFGPAWAEAYIRKKDNGVFVEILQNGLAMAWLNQQMAAGFFVASQIARFDQAVKHLAQTRIGFGIERSLYTLCPELHCLSEMFDGYFVTSPEQVIRTFEKLCQQNKVPSKFIDRHIAAFIAVRDSKLIEPLLFELASMEDHKRLLAELRMMARMQKILKVGKCPGIATRFLTIIDPVVKRFHDREMRDKLRKQLDGFAKEGSLIKMINTIDNSALRKKDLGKFRRAIIEHKRLAEEAKVLDEKLQNKSSYDRHIARRVAATVSCVMAVILILFALGMSSGGTSAF